MSVVQDELLLFKPVYSHRFMSVLLL